MAVILNNVLTCSLNDGHGIKYVKNTGRIARISDRLDSSSDDSKPVEHRPEAIQLDGPRVNREDGGNVNRGEG